MMQNRLMTSHVQNGLFDLGVSPKLCPPFRKQKKVPLLHHIYNVRRCSDVGFGFHQRCSGDKMQDIRGNQERNESGHPIHTEIVRVLRLRSDVWPVIKLMSVTILPIMLHLPSHVWVAVNIGEAVAYDVMRRNLTSALLGFELVLWTIYLPHLQATLSNQISQMNALVLHVLGYMGVYCIWNVNFAWNLHGILTALSHNLVPTVLTLGLAYWFGTKEWFYDHWIDVFAYGRANAIAITLLSYFAGKRAGGHSDLDHHVDLDRSSHDDDRAERMSARGYHNRIKGTTTGGVKHHEASHGEKIVRDIPPTLPVR
jgi:hypothetical protein